MSLVRRKTPEEIKVATRSRARRAAQGIALCVTALLGIGIASSAVAAERVEKVQSALEDYLQPEANHMSFKSTSSSQQEVLAKPAMHDTGTETEFIIGDEPEPPRPDKGIDWATPLKAVGGTAAGCLGVFVLLGLANRRGRHEDNNGYDIETTEGYAMYGFEVTGNRAHAALNVQSSSILCQTEQLDTGSAVFEHDVNAQLIATRIASPLNLSHMKVLGELGSDPLEALTYRV